MSVVRPRVLIAEDSPTARTFLEDALEGMELDLLVTENGEEALALALKEVVDLMVLDIDMPKLRGLQVCRFVKENEFLRVIPVLMLSTVWSSSELFQAMTASLSRKISLVSGTSSVSTA